MEEKMQKAKDMKPEDMLFTYKGVLYPSLLCKPENFKAMERFEAREDDILLVAYPKCVQLQSWGLLEEPLELLLLAGGEAGAVALPQFGYHLLESWQSGGSVGGLSRDSSCCWGLVESPDRTTHCRWVGVLKKAPVVCCWSSGGKLDLGRQLPLGRILEKGSHRLPLVLRGEVGLERPLPLDRSLEKGSQHLLLELGGQLDLEHRSLEKGSRRLPLMPTGLRCGFAHLREPGAEGSGMRVGRSSFWPTRQASVDFRHLDMSVNRGRDGGSGSRPMDLSKLPSQRIMGTHVHPKDIPASFFEKKTKVLVIFRNPKDTAVSYFHFYNKNPALPAFDSWDKFFSQYMSGEVMLGSYFDHAVAWEKHIDSDTVKIIIYEDMIENLTEGIQQVAKFFSLSLSDEQVQAIAQESTFETMKNKSKETHGQMGNVIFRKGGVGDWKNHFSEEQSKELDAKFEQCLAGTKIGAKLKYEVHCK
ncbi:Sulfotransferase 6B1 [Acipenser ruthenus]|uniref:Sulfotransferase n=1 Tax=Acipenser ruthenus TaxID=7906 RepID=A0A444UN07_ACIRT|nr:Sulfotransferase 6B1 [Acipenser ruthenus]